MALGVIAIIRQWNRHLAKNGMSCKCGKERLRFVTYILMFGTATVTGYDVICCHILLC